MNLFAILCVGINPLVIDAVSVLDVLPRYELPTETIQVSTIPIVNITVKVVHKEHSKSLS